MTEHLATAVELSPLLATILQRARGLHGPCVVAIEGRSGAGKSTLAAQLADALGGCVLEGDDFFAGGVLVRDDWAADRVRDCIDWRRQRPVLEALRAGRDATYFAFDWEAFDGSLATQPKRLVARPFVIFEGVYSARTELTDLVDLRVLLRVREETRGARLVAREGGIGAWERQWHEAEDWYFAHEALHTPFDLVLDESLRERLGRAHQQC